MTWTSLEKSIENSRVVEIYQITTDSTTYFYTSSSIDFSWEGQIYTALPIARTDHAANSVGGEDSKIILSIDAAIVATITGVCPQRMSATAYRVQLDEGVATKFLDGPITTRSITEDAVEFTLTDYLSDTVESEIPTIRISAMCNHALYDARCGVDRTAFDQAATISSISTDGRTLVVSTIGGQVDQWFTDGEITTSDGQRRTIVNQVGTTISIRVAFNDLSVSQAVTLFAGCPHLIDACFTKFNNVANFAGHPRVPSKNPFWNQILGRDEEF